MLATSSRATCWFRRRHCSRDCPAHAVRTSDEKAFGHPRPHVQRAIGEHDFFVGREHRGELLRTGRGPPTSRPERGEPHLDVALGTRPPVDGERSIRLLVMPRPFPAGHLCRPSSVRVGKSCGASARHGPSRPSGCHVVNTVGTGSSAAAAVAGSRTQRPAAPATPATRPKTRAIGVQSVTICARHSSEWTLK
jgi:hypothetical protein